MKTKIKLLMIAFVAISLSTKVKAQFVRGSPSWATGFSGDQFGFGGVTSPAFIIDVNGDINISNGAYKYGGADFLKLSNTDNILLGISSGLALSSTGRENVFVGNNTGTTNTTGKSNAFLGYNAGNSNVTGDYNSFFGRGAGYLNTTGSNNSYFGYGSYGDANISNATAIGANAIVHASNSMVLGDGTVNVGIGTSTPSYTLDVNGYIRSSPLAGTGTRLVTADANGKLVIGSPTSILNNWSLTGNSGTNPIINFIGTTDALDLIIATNSTEAIHVSSTTENLGIGTSTPSFKLDVNGDINMSTGKVVRINAVPVLNNQGPNNIFVGDEAGKSNSGQNGTFLGYKAGHNSNSGYNNTFIGYYAGNANTTGQENTYIGSNVGINSAATAMTPASSPSSMYQRNTFLGYGAYGSVTTTNNLEHSSAIGADAIVDASNNIILGSPNTEVALDHVGIGVKHTDSKTKFHVDANGLDNTAIFMGGMVGIGTPSPTHTLTVSGEANVTSTIFANYAQVEYDIKSMHGNAIIAGDVAVGGDVIPQMSTSLAPLSNLGTSSTTAWFNYAYAAHDITVSDKRLKSEITDINYGLKELMKLHPVTYYFKSNSTEKRIGFIAQELREIIPEVVFGTENDSSYLGVAYSDLVPVLVNSIQEQQKTIDALQQQINNLAGNNIQNSNSPSLNNNRNLSKNTTNSLVGDVSVLYQNQPNPFKENTAIEYYLLPNTQKASLLIFDMNGTLLKTFLITQFGKGAVLLNGGDLKPGMFYYSLIADNKEIDSKKMILLD